MFLEEGAVPWPQSQVSGLTKPQQPPLCQLHKRGQRESHSLHKAQPREHLWVIRGLASSPQELIYTVCRWQWKPATGFLHSLSHVLGTGQLGVLNTALALTRSLATSRRGDDNKDDSSYLPDIHICQAFARKMEGSKQGVKLTGCLDAQRRDHHQPLQLLYFSFKIIGKK